jgi:hypothetical protein
LEKQPVLQSSRTASALLPLVIRVLHLTPQHVVLKEKKLDHQMARLRTLLHLDNQHLVNQTLDNQPLVNQPLDNQPLDNQPLDNQPLDNQELNKVRS